MRRLFASIRYFALVCTLWGASSFLPVTEAAPATAFTLQEMIDQAAAGATIQIPTGTYEGHVTIQKPLTLVAQGEVKIVGRQETPIVSIEVDGVELRGLTVVDERVQPSEAAVLVKGSGNKLYNLHITTRSTGVRLQEAHRNHLQMLTIDSSAPKNGHGIDLWKADENLIEQCQITGVLDGVYVESSKLNRIVNNHVAHSRYGYHLMFSQQIVLHGNSGFHNITGAMVMGVDDSEVSHNTFAMQSENVNAQGILLFDVKNTRVTDNQLAGNRVGMYVEQSKANTIRDNYVAHNFIGLQLLKAEANEIAGNQFLANVVQAQAQRSKENLVAGNYWDDAWKLDLTGDGYSDLTYRVNPFFLQLTKGIPPLQILFHSPGMVFLEGLFAATDERVEDVQPLMKQPNGSLGEAQTSSSARMMLISLLLLFLSTTTIVYVGVVRK